MFRRRSTREANSLEADPSVHDGLRSMALSSVANGLATPSADHPDVSGLVIDIPARGGFVTVVALTDSTTSMYTSVGVVKIGAGAHERVATANHALLSVAEASFATFTRSDEGTLPQPTLVRFHLLTPAGSIVADVPEESFWGRARHQLMPVIAATQAVITAIREAPEP